MRTGRLAISRGHQLVHGSEEAATRMAVVPAPPRPEPLALHEPAAEAAPAHPLTRPELLSDHVLIDHRLGALERLTRLLEHGVLSEEEFADEKALILGRFARRPAPDAPVAFVAATRTVQRQRGPSLLGRLFGGWRVIPVGLAAGLALSFAAQPAATWNFFDETLRLFGF